MEQTTSGERECARCGLRLPYGGDWYGSLCPTCADESESARPLRQFKLTVPTYNANYFHEQVAANQMKEFGEPLWPVLVHEAEGVRIVLGTHKLDDLDRPDIQIERQPNGWVIFLHPLGGSDPSGYIYFLDDGQSYVAKELPYGPTPPIDVLEQGTELEEFYGPKCNRSGSEKSIQPDEPALRHDSGFDPLAQ